VHILVVGRSDPDIIHKSGILNFRSRSCAGGGS
jgi:hypothetical protein